jgi:hypothetical protein
MAFAIEQFFACHELRGLSLPVNVTVLLDTLGA